MPYYFHEHREIYFQHQTAVTKEYIIPFIEQVFRIEPKRAVLEIGCGEGGVLKAFLDRGCKATGVDLDAEKLALARRMFSAEIANGQIEFINKNIYDPDFKEAFKNKFDLIVLKDAIEHIPEQQKLLSYLHTFLKPKGVIFFAFPPWYMPFGGHQQMCRSFLKKTPYFHLLPMPVYKAILKLMRESDSRIQTLLHNKRTGITIERFERILRRTGYRVLQKEFFLFNPIYRYKFKLTPKKQYRWLTAFPYVRNFFTTAVYYVVEPE